MREWLRSVSNFLSNKKIIAIEVRKQNLRQYGARDLDGFDLTQPARQPTPTEIRGLATGAILFFYGDNPIKLLPQLKPAEREERKAATAQWWGIYGTEDALEVLQNLRREGHRHKFQQQLKHESLQWYNRFAAHPFLKSRTVTNVGAWDYARLVNVARWCYDYGYLSWEQAWPFIDAGTRLALRDYDSWDSFAAGFVAGRLLWDVHNDSHADIAEVARYLLESPVSLWRDIPWQPYPVA
ncbi:DUF1266 domain-containing protein [Hymenobacter chitinivorans]|uniref:Uncharacterized protein DUF1266 n=1 Tax=Hymenobacter chitinivorans DSM 11115 TaxID=1121954 RepID=A0A2M9BTF7_9BACT|nr:DUF1266 domain-containing protein [Hymenobacter chitinivorans]PJJ61211.1 uncharacterized protein DUF1266 [Hymenobacter chitinivorans DSM 11115]